MNINRQVTTPISTPRTRRNQSVEVLTSIPAGVMAPVAVFPMLREDALSAQVNIMVEMQETTELIVNPVACRVTAYLFPTLAAQRFQGSRDQFDRSYMKQPKDKDVGAVVTPFIETAAYGTFGSNAVYKALGLHAQPTDQVNTLYLEAYNAIWNFRAKNRSPEITERARLATTLAPAFWLNSRFEHVVPDFDQAVIDGEVALNVVQANLPVKGIGLHNTNFSTVAGSIPLRETGSVTPRTTTGWTIEGAASAPGGGEAWLDIEKDPAGLYPAIYAELAENGITVSLSNIELARKTQAFAKLRERYTGFDDEYIIDMLMDGLTIPDQFLKQPILVGDKTVRFSQAKRYATDAGNLAESAVSGGAAVRMNIRVPKLATGGVVMVFVECLPDQLFERQQDPFFTTTNVDQLPAFLRDTLDPEKVDVVLNKQVDSAHATPTDTFGYAPLNWKWNSWGPRVGGKFMRPTTDAGTDTARQRLWAVESTNPVLGSDFYLVKLPMQIKPFLDTESDPFELSAVGNAVITGETVFGGMLVEATNNYDKVLEKAPTERIEKEA